MEKRSIERFGTIKTKLHCKICLLYNKKRERHKAQDKDSTRELVAIAIDTSYEESIVESKEDIIKSHDENS